MINLWRKLGVQCINSINSRCQCKYDHVHSNLCNINLLDVTPSLILKTIGNGTFSIQILLLIIKFPSHISWV